MPTALPLCSRPAKSSPKRVALAAALTLALTSGPALAQSGYGGSYEPGFHGHDGGWHDGGGHSNWGDHWDSQPPPFSGDDAREGRVTTDRFPAPDAAPQLGHGSITVTTPDAHPQDGAHDGAHDNDGPRPDAPRPGAPPIAPLPGAYPDSGRAYVTPREAAVFEAAVIDQLVKAGYNTAAPASTSPAPGGQLAELRITHDLLTPAEQRRSPVSGEMAMGASNRGSMMGLGISIDLSKPRAALIGTTLALRIRDAATGKPLWEGRASIATREGSSRWPQQAIATRLATALFEGFATSPAPGH